MALKIFLVVAVACFSQVLARGALFNQSPPPAGVQDYEQLPLELIEVLDAMDEFADAVTLKFMESYFVKRDSKAALCYRDQKNKYLALSKNFETNLKEAFYESTNQIKGQKKLIRSVQAPLKSITDYVHSLSKLMWYLLKDKEFDQAVKLMQDYREKIRENEAEFESAFEKLVEKYEAAKEFKERYNGIRVEAQVESKAISDEFHKCISGKTPDATTSNDISEDEEEEEDYEDEE